MAAPIRKITTVLVVDAISPSLEFFRERLGFTVTVEVPHGDGVGFVILERGGVEVMLQTAESVAADLGTSFAPKGAGESALLFIEVADLEAIQASLGDYELGLPNRTTFYGMREIGVIEPGGHRIILAQPTGT